ncbi:hypothetical protein GYMLUDRAFT_43447 [Collybiopsis luxurians FD-317 M1]|uniref:Uncharacterized protein n=1 Tax=Collybiopsis luxurians FD-317 M1 TaxID=944289 RepID=A0A0D0BAU1_9AGAR|nr:hypothetical protein GYMLUDRAFT_43447 [Collybiopsis luxurians FD-317 M1]
MPAVKTYAFIVAAVTSFALQAAAAPIEFGVDINLNSREQHSDASLEARMWNAAKNAAGKYIDQSLSVPKGQMTNQQKQNIKNIIGNSGGSNPGGGPAKFDAYKQKIEEQKIEAAKQQDQQGAGASSSSSSSTQQTNSRDIQDESDFGVRSYNRLVELD